MDDEIDEALSDMDEPESTDLGDEWRAWHMDDLELESDEPADEGSEDEKEELGKKEILRE